MTRTSAGNNWFISPKPNPTARLNLFCFPYAGSGTQVYWKWADYLPQGVELHLAQLPGRGTRLLETPYTRMLPLVQTIADAMDSYTDKPFALFGHSMGAIISFELARLRRERLDPVQLFVSGCRAPQMRPTDYRTFDWPEAEFIADLRRLNGTPPEVLEHPELMQLMLPLLRADFEVIQTYSYAEGEPLKCPITAFGGLEDHEVLANHLEGWREQTTAAFTCRRFPGDHFFINASQSLILRALAQDLYQLLQTLT